MIESTNNLSVVEITDGNDNVMGLRSPSFDLSNI